MATKRIIQLPTLNNWQVTWGNSSQWGYLRRLPNELPWWDWPNPKLVIQTPQTDANGNITGWWWKKTAMNSPEEPEVWTYRGDNGVVQTIDKRVQQGWQPATTYGSKTDRSATLLNTGKSWTTNWLPQATPANLPWVTKYAGIDKNYWNNQAGIDLVNKQNELDTLSEAEKAQRLAGAYNPTPTVATTQNPVIKKTLDKPQEQTVTPAVLQGADMNTLNSTLDELNYKVNVEGKTLTKEEYLVYAGAKRQLQDMMKPQALTGGLDGLIANKEQDIKQATDESKVNNEQELADFTKSQEVYKQAELDNIQKSFEREQETMRLILAWQWAGQGTFAVDKLNELSQNNQQKISILNEAVQAKIDLYGSQLRKDSQATIEAMKTRLDNFYLKAADLDVKNIEMMNAYNKEQGADKIKQLDWLMALAQSQALSSKELTPEEQKQVDTFANNLYDENGDFRDDVFKMLKEINPNLANLAVYNGGAIQKQRIADDLAMKWLDADIKRAQLNKLLNPDVDYKVEDNGDWTYTRTWSDWSVAIVDPTADVWWLSWAELAKTLASGKINWKKFFGVYATGDPDGTQFASIYNKVAEQWLDAYMKSRQDRGSKITADMVNQAAIATGVDPITIAAKMAQDSWMGTQGKGARNNNPWNVGQFDSLDAKWITVKGYNTLEEWVLAVADNFRKRADALQWVVWSQQTPEASDKRMAVQGLIQWLWGTEWERAKFANNIIKVAERDWITLQEAKKKLGYKSWDDLDFAKSRADQFKTIKKSSDAITKWKQALSLLNSGKATAIKDVATIVWFLKTIDPSSVARESEVESVETARWALDSLSNTFEKMNTGKKLTDTQRQELKDTIGIIVNEYENNMKDFITSSSQEFDDRWLDMTVYVPKDTINKYKQMQSTQTTTWSLSWWTNRLQK